MQTRCSTRACCENPLGEQYWVDTVLTLVLVPCATVPCPLHKCAVGRSMLSRELCAVLPGCCLLLGNKRGPDSLVDRAWQDGGLD